jgi:hypothetical protein
MAVAEIARLPLPAEAFAAVYKTARPPVSYHNPCAYFSSKGRSTHGEVVPARKRPCLDEA